MSRVFWETCVKLGQRALEEGDLDQSLEAFLTALDAAKTNRFAVQEQFQAYQYVASVLQMKGDFLASLPYYQEAISLVEGMKDEDPKLLLTAKLQYAGALQASGKWQQALKELDSVEEFSHIGAQERVELLFSKARLFKNLTHFKESAEVYHHLLDNFPQLQPQFQEQILTELASCYLSLEDREGAQEIWDQLLESSSDDLGRARKLFHIGSSYYSLGDYAHSLFLLGEALEFVGEAPEALEDPDFPYDFYADLLEKMATSLTALKEFEKAQNLLLETIEVREAKFGKEHPKSLLGWRNFALILGAESKIEQALKLYQKITPKLQSQYPADHPVILACYQELNDLLMALGQPEKANSWLDHWMDQIPKENLHERVQVLMEKALNAHQGELFETAAQLYTKVWDLLGQDKLWEGKEQAKANCLLGWAEVQKELGHQQKLASLKEQLEALFQGWDLVPQRWSDRLQALKV